MAYVTVIDCPAGTVPPCLSLSPVPVFVPIITSREEEEEDRSDSAEESAREDSTYLLNAPSLVGSTAARHLTREKLEPAVP
jgi:hypothetical protein